MFERIFSAIRHLGRRTEPANTIINLAPADERKEGATLDVAMAMAFLAAAGDVPASRLEDRLLLGELSLEVSRLELQDESVIELQLGEAEGESESDLLTVLGTSVLAAALPARAAARRPILDAITA